MMSEYYMFPDSCGMWLNFKVSVQLNRKFSVLEVGMQKVLEDRSHNLNNHMYYCYVAPVIAQLFYYYNSDIKAIAVLSKCVDYLQAESARNPVAKQLLDDFLQIANTAGVEYRTVTYKVNI